VLFDRICELPEYYPTRTERAILERVADELIAATGASELVELGSGSATKTRLLLDAMSAAGTLERFIAVDVTEEVVRAGAAELTQEYPGLHVHGLIGDFERHLDRLPPARGPRLVAFLGGTIGNLDPAERHRFLRIVAGLLGDDDHLLLGTDLIKDRATLEAAYDDAAGVTAEFNRNVLLVLNRELGPTSIPRPSTTSPSSTPRTNGSRCACARASAGRGAARDWPGGPFRGRRGGADRDQRQVHP